MLRSAHDAEDITQEVLLLIYRSLPEYRLDGLKTWITRIAVNRAIDFKRRKERRPEQLVEPELWDREVGSEPNEFSPAPAAESVVLQEEERRMLLERIDELPDNYREVISAYYIEDKSYEQIATETGLERKSVESRLYRARNWMKRHWRREDFE